MASWKRWFPGKEGAQGAAGAGQGDLTHGSPRVLIVTALKLEFDEVLEHLSSRRTGLDDSNLLCCMGHFEAEGVRWSVLVICTEASNPKAAAATAKVICRFDPAVALMVGIAGGRKDVERGHVVVAETVVGYESVKDLDPDDGPSKNRPAFYPASDRLFRTAVRLIWTATWKDRIRGSGYKPQAEAVKGDLASGEKVVCAGSTIARLLDQHYDNVLATEMEGRGFCEAVKQFIDIERLVLRGISDLLYGPPEGHKSPAADRVRQPMAAAHAAAFAFELLARIENPTRLVQQEPRIARSTMPFARYSGGGPVDESQFLHDLGARFNGGSTQGIRIGPMFRGLASGSEDIEEICIQGAEDRIARIAALMQERPKDLSEFAQTWRIRNIACSDGLMSSPLYPIVEPPPPPPPPLDWILSPAASDSLDLDWILSPAASDSLEHAQGRSKVWRYEARIAIGPEAKAEVGGGHLAASDLTVLVRGESPGDDATLWLEVVGFTPDRDLRVWVGFGAPDTAVTKPADADPNWHFDSGFELCLTPKQRRQLRDGGKMILWLVEAQTGETRRIAADAPRDLAGWLAGKTD